MPIIQPEEYPDLKAKGLISLKKQPSGKIRVTIDRGEDATYDRAAILAWLDGSIADLRAQIDNLTKIKTDVEAL